VKNLSGQRKSFKPLLFFGVFVCLWSSHPSQLLSSDLPLRTINIKIAADVEFKSRYLWDTKIYDLINACSSRFRRNFGLRLNFKSIEYWKPPEDLNCISDAYNELRRKINTGDCDVVFGIVSSKCIQKPPYGISDYCNGYILVKHIESGEDFGVQPLGGFLKTQPRRYFKYRDEMKLTMLHELCHMFGAVDLDEQGSVMSDTYLGSKIDEFTRKVISSHRHRTFDETHFPLRKSQLETVIELFKDRRDLNRDEPQVMCFLANILLENGDYESAILECEKGLCLNPIQPGLLCLLGRAFRRAGQLDRAVSQYLKALAFQPANSDYHFNLGLAYLDLGMTPLAIKEFRRAIDLNPGCAMFHYNLGVAFAGKNMLDSAIHAFKKAIELKRNYHQAFANLAQSYLKQGALAEGIATAKAALEINPDDPCAYSNLGWAYLLCGSMDKAMRCCQRAVDLEPDLPQPHKFLGVLYTHQNNSEAAIEEFKMAIALSPNYSEAHISLADLLYQNNNISRSIHHYKRAVEIDSAHVGALLSLADIYFFQEYYAKAWDYVVEAEKSGVDVNPEFKIKVLNKLGVNRPEIEQNLKR